jgi:hypothetical protein
MLTLPDTRRPTHPRARSFAWTFHSLAVCLNLAAAVVLGLVVSDGALAASITLGWSPPTNTTQIAGYQLHFGTSSGRYQSVRDVAGASTASATVDGLTAGSTYYFAVRARNAAASVVSAFSNEVSAKIPSSADTAAPTISSFATSPVGSTYTAARSVAFTAVATDNVGVAKVEFYDGSTLKGTDVSSPYSYAWSLTSAANGTHTWTAKAYDAANNVRVSSALTRTVSLETAAPSIPGGLSASAASTARINLSWSASSDNVGVSAYLVERCLGAGCKSFAQVASVATTSYASTGLAAGSTYRYRVRARDAANNRSAYSVVVGATTPSASGCAGSSVWAATATPTNLSSWRTESRELGMKFRSDVGGNVCGVRFYKGSANTGTHVGSLWTSGGALLARATFTQETTSGWQQVNFATPVAIKANTVYVVSYLAPAGRYSYDRGYFTDAGVDRAPLHALKTGISGGNGVYVRGSGFPTDTSGDANYWVDVVFAKTSAAASLSSQTLEAAAERAADSIGVYNPQTQRFYLDTDASRVWSAGDTKSEPFGSAGDIAIVGDWTGDGVDKIGVYRPSDHTFVLDVDGTDSATSADLVASFGALGDLPTVGDWNGDGIDEVGVYRPGNGLFYLDVDNSYSANAEDVQSAPFGTAEDLPVAGDWNGDGVDEIGVYRPSTGRFYLDMDTSYSWTTGDIETEAFANPDDLPVVGDWNADGATDIGVYRPSTRAFLLDSDGSDTWTSQDLQTAAFGSAGDRPLSGRWQARP